MNPSIGRSSRLVVKTGIFAAEHLSYNSASPEPEYRVNYCSDYGLIDFDFREMLQYLQRF